VQVSSLRPKLRDLAGSEFPQIVLRLGEPVDELAASPRRPIDDLMDRPS